MCLFAVNLVFDGFVLCFDGLIFDDLAVLVCCFTFVFGLDWVD